MSWIVILRNSFICYYPTWYMNIGRSWILNNFFTRAIHNLWNDNVIQYIDQWCWTSKLETQSTQWKCLIILQIITQSMWKPIFPKDWKRGIGNDLPDAMLWENCLSGTGVCSIHYLHGGKKIIYKYANCPAVVQYIAQLVILCSLSENLKYPFWINISL